MTNLEGTTAVITGASRGIGAAVARSLAEEGVNLGLGSRSGDNLGIEGAVARHCDVRDPDQLDALVSETVERFGGLDILVVNASVGHATLRRSRPGPQDPEEPGIVTVGDVEIDFASRRVTKSGELVHLTPTEFSLLHEFATNPGVLLTHAALLRRVWGSGYETQTEYTRVYVARLRAKLETVDGPPMFITEPRSGYRFTTD